MRHFTELVDENALQAITGGMRFTSPAPLPVRFVSEWNEGSKVICTFAEADAVTGLVFNVEAEDDVEDLRILDAEYAILPDGSDHPVTSINGSYVLAEKAIVRFQGGMQVGYAPELKPNHFYLASGIDEQFLNLSTLSGQFIGRYWNTPFQAVNSRELLKDYPGAVLDYPELVAAAS